MANNIIDIRKNYREVEDLLSFHYKEVEGEEFYRYVFPVLLQSFKSTIK